MTALLDINLLVALASVSMDEIPLVGYRQVTDAHLLALALRRGGRLATLDGKIRSLVPRSHNASEILSLVLEG